MKQNLILIILFPLILLSKETFSQILYNDLSKVLEYSQDEINELLKKNKWEYVGYNSEIDSHEWKFFGSSLKVKNFKNKSLRKVEFISHSNEFYILLIKSLGQSEKFKPGIEESHPSVVYNFYYGKFDETAVGHLICKDTDSTCILRLDLMKTSSFKKSDYKPY